MTQLAIKSFWQKPLAIARSIDARQLGLVLPIGIMIRDPAGSGSAKEVRTCGTWLIGLGAEESTEGDYQHFTANGTHPISSPQLSFFEAALSKDCYAQALKKTFRLSVLIPAGMDAAQESVLVLSLGTGNVNAASVTSADSVIRLRLLYSDDSQDLLIVGRTEGEVRSQIFSFRADYVAGQRFSMFYIPLLQSLTVSIGDLEYQYNLPNIPKLSGDNRLALGLIYFTFGGSVAQISAAASIQEAWLEYLSAFSEVVAGEIEENRLAISNKADQSSLDALALLVDTKADASAVAQQIADLVGTDAQVLAAIQEIGAALADDQDLLDALEYTVANRVRFDVNNQALTALQKSNARTNIGAEEIGVAAMLIAQITAASIGAATALQGAKAETALQATDAPAAVRGTALTGLSLATATPITATDTVLSGVGKLQAQITAQRQRAKVPRSAGRFYGNCQYGTPFSASVVAALQRRTAFFEPHFDMTVDQIGLVVTVAPPSAARIWLAVYEMDAATPSQLNLLHTFNEIAVDTTVGAKMTGAAYTFQQGRTYVFVHHSDTALNIRNVSVYAGLSIGLTTADATAPSTFFFENAVPYVTPPSTINTATMTMAASNPTLIVMRSA